MISSLRLLETIKIWVMASITLATDYIRTHCKGCMCGSAPLAKATCFLTLPVPRHQPLAFCLGILNEVQFLGLSKSIWCLVAWTFETVFMLLPSILRDMFSQDNLFILWIHTSVFKKKKKKNCSWFWSTWTDLHIFWKTHFWGMMVLSIC